MMAVLKWRKKTDYPPANRARGSSNPILMKPDTAVTCLGPSFGLNYIDDSRKISFGTEFA